MTPYQNRLTPTVLRMAEDMRIRNFAQATIDAYTYHVDKFEKHCGKSVTELGADDIHNYQLHLVDVKKSFLEPIQSSRLWVTFPVRNYSRKGLDGRSRL